MIPESATMNTYLNYSSLRRCDWSTKKISQSGLLWRKSAKNRSIPFRFKQNELQVVIPY
jgi:hypothetical protein